MSGQGFLEELLSNLANNFISRASHVVANDPDCQVRATESAVERALRNASGAYGYPNQASTASAPSTGLPGKKGAGCGGGGAKKAAANKNGRKVQCCYMVEKGKEGRIRCSKQFAEPPPNGQNFNTNKEPVNQWVFGDRVVCSIHVNFLNKHADKINKDNFFMGSIFVDGEGGGSGSSSPAVSNNNYQAGSAEEAVKLITGKGNELFIYKSGPLTGLLFFKVPGKADIAAAILKPKEGFDYELEKLSTRDDLTAFINNKSMTKLDENKISNVNKFLESLLQVPDNKPPNRNDWWDITGMARPAVNSSIMNSVCADFNFDDIIDVPIPAQNNDANVVPADDPFDLLG